MGSFDRLNLLKIVSLELMLELLELLHAVGLAIGKLAPVFLSFFLRLQQLIVRLGRNALDSVSVVRDLVISLVDLFPKLTNLSFIRCLGILELALEVLEFELVLPSEFRSLPTFHSFLLLKPILEHLELPEHFLPLLLEVPEEGGFLIGQGLAFVSEDVAL